MAYYSVRCSPISPNPVWPNHNRLRLILFRLWLQLRIGLRLVVRVKVIVSFKVKIKRNGGRGLLRSVPDAG